MNIEQTLPSIILSRAVADALQLQTLSEVVSVLRDLDRTMPMQEAAVLFEIARRPGTTVTDVQSCVSIAQSSVSRRVASLEGMGLIVKVACGEDSRQHRLCLSEKGVLAVADLLELIPSPR